MSSRNPYEVLGVPRTATTRQIRLAYVERARRAHPDLVGHRGTEVMRALNEAWETLKDADRRTALDATLAGGLVDVRNVATGGAGGETARGAPATDPLKPFWTGAAGPPPGRPSGSVLDFGIFAGWSLGEILRRDKGYLYWLRDRPDGKPYAAEIDRLVNPGAEEEQPARSRRHR